MSIVNKPYRNDEVSSRGEMENNLKLIILLIGVGEICVTGFFFAEGLFLQLLISEFLSHAHYRREKSFFPQN
jgi:hypothetical protein